MINMINISLDSVIVQGQGNIASDMDGEKVMLSVQKGKYYNLGMIGGTIWDLIKTPTSVSQIVSVLTSEYDVSQKECEEQVLSFLEHLNAEDLILLAE